MLILLLWLLWDILYIQKARKLNFEELQKISDNEIINSFTVIESDFKFPDDTKYPSIPVFLDETATVYPLQGTCIITGIEYVIAKNQGCVFSSIKDIVQIPFGTVKPFITF